MGNLFAIEPNNVAPMTLQVEIPISERMNKDEDVWPLLVLLPCKLQLLVIIYGKNTQRLKKV